MEKCIKMRLTNVWSSANASGIALYLIQPETLVAQVTVITVSSGLGWIATKRAHQKGSALWRKRCAELEADFKESEKTPEAKKDEQELKDATSKLLDELFANPELQKAAGFPQTSN